MLEKKSLKGVKAIKEKVLTLNSSAALRLCAFARGIAKSILAALCLSLILSCAPRGSSTSETPANEPDTVMTTHLGAKPEAVLKTGEHPLWFQLTDTGPVLLESIEDAVFSAALVPWTHALHISNLSEHNGEIIMAVNREGFLKLSPYPDVENGVAMYRFPGGELWRQYTIGGFVFYEENPAALLYLNDRFLDTALPHPPSRTWTFGMTSNTPFPLEIPALEFFPAKDGWTIDTLRFASDGFFYYRAAKRNAAVPVIRTLKTANLSREGSDVSLDDFYNSAARKNEISHPSLPPLPEGFLYTAAGQIGDSLAASWEEQEDFSIGAAGFVVIKISP